MIARKAGMGYFENSRNNHMSKAFTLLELLVVVAIIGILAILIVPAVSGIQERSRQSQTSSNLRQIGAALFSFANDNDGNFPKATADIPYLANPAPEADISWQQRLDPYINFQDESITETTGARKVFTAASSVDRGTLRGQNSFFLGSYAAGYEFKALPPPAVFAPVRLNKITRPTIHILAGEVGNKGQFAPYDTDKDDYSDNNPAFGLKDPSRIVQILFADGHVAGFKSFDPDHMTVRYEGVDENGKGYSYTSYY